MDIWGTGPFENEAGAAFADEVVQDGEFALAEAFDVALDPDTDFLAAEEGHRTLAAAEILAAVLDGDTQNIVSARLRSWVQEADAVDLAPLRDVARDAVGRVVGPESELPDLWAENADADEWLGTVQGLQMRLEG
ncbi:DUF4259 domain-containing protein [Deinococcus humi]|uniref:DUF4259 domain-containing protein n=1 Tax=Deinococcus humi TaxID=662880 RepID=A0A7W8JU74_9DEIO|nr:DUF4259 domain-containing protein [Deinococcus humi]MBB5362028.1 hypothetical protein [Deinococcus humi]GGO22420.1 hypothetical protein GCM10008949_09670 [Deinococcus humi]